MTTRRATMFLVACLLTAASAHAQLPNPYGTPIGVETAKKAAAPAVAEARKNNWTMAVAVVDIAGNLVYFEKMDGTQNGSVQVAMDKARSSAPSARRGARASRTASAPRPAPTQ